MIPHFIYCMSENYVDFEGYEKMFRRKMKKYGIRSSILTVLHMARHNLITKETQKQAYEGKLKNERDWSYFEGSVTDDLESFLNKLINKEEITREMFWSFFLPKLTEEELKLVAEKDYDHLNTYWAGSTADVDEEEMKRSDSKDKYVRVLCRRYTIPLTLDANVTLSADEILEESFQYILNDLTIE